MKSEQLALYILLPLEIVALLVVSALWICCFIRIRKQKGSPDAAEQLPTFPVATVSGHATTLFARSLLQPVVTKEDDPIYTLLTAKDFKKKRQVKINKRLQFPLPSNELSDVTKKSPEKNIKIKLNKKQCEVYEVGSEIELVIDAQGRPIVPADSLPLRIKKPGPTEESLYYGKRSGDYEDSDNELGSGQVLQTQPTMYTETRAAATEKPTTTTTKNQRKTNVGAITTDPELSKKTKKHRKARDYSIQTEKTAKPSAVTMKSKKTPKTEKQLVTHEVKWCTVM